MWHQIPYNFVLDLVLLLNPAKFLQDYFWMCSHYWVTFHSLLPGQVLHISKAYYLESGSEMKVK